MITWFPAAGGGDARRRAARRRRLQLIGRLLDDPVFRNAVKG